MFCFYTSIKKFHLLTPEPNNRAFLTTKSQFTGIWFSSLFLLKGPDTENNVLGLDNLPYFFVENKVESESRFTQFHCDRLKLRLKVRTLKG